MRNNFLSLVIWLVAWFMATFILKSLHLGGSGVFYGIMLPLIASAACLLSQAVSKYRGADVDHIYAGVGAAIGGALVIYIVPMLQVH